MYSTVSRLDPPNAPTGEQAQAASSTPSVGRAQPGPRATGDLPRRASRARDDFALPMPRPSAAAGMLASRPREVTLERSRTEAGLLGTQRWQQLNQQFGKPAWAYLPGVRRAICPWERKDHHPIVHPHRFFVPAEGGRMVDLTKVLDLAGLKADALKYNFVVSPVGALIIGAELPVPWIARVGGPMPHLGHPTLTGGGPSRIAGELRYDRDKDEFYINDNSGRFSRHFHDRGPEQLANAAERFRAAGLVVGVRHGGRR